MPRHRPLPAPCRAGSGTWVASGPAMEAIIFPVMKWVDRNSTVLLVVAALAGVLGLVIFVSP